MISFFEDDDPTKIRRSLFLILTMIILISEIRVEANLVELIAGSKDGFGEISAGDVRKILWCGAIYLAIRHVLNIRASYLAYRSNKDETLADDIDELKTYVENQKKLQRKNDYLRSLPSRLSSLLDSQQQHGEEVGRLAEESLGNLQQTLQKTKFVYPKNLGQNVVNTEKSIEDLKSRAIATVDFANLKAELRDYDETVGSIISELDKFTRFPNDADFVRVQRATSDKVKSVEYAALDRFFVANVALILVLGLAIHKSQPQFYPFLESYILESFNNELATPTPTNSVRPGFLVTTSSASTN